eukprot:977448-Prorocentrum_minimum.AAC.4
MSALRGQGTRSRRFDSKGYAPRLAVPAQTRVDLARLGVISVTQRGACVCRTLRSTDTAAGYLLSSSPPPPTRPGTRGTPRPMPLRLPSPADSGELS